MNGRQVGKVKKKVASLLIAGYPSRCIDANAGQVESVRAVVVELQMLREAWQRCEVVC
jgi:hypothetical protein